LIFAIGTSSAKKLISQNYLRISVLNKE